MTIKQRLGDDLKAAMKAGDKTRVSCLRMLRSRVQEREVALRPERGMAHELDDDEAQRVLAAYAKQRKDSIEAYRQGGREELAAQEEAELAIVESYLPERMSEEDLRAVVAEEIAGCGATSPAEMGQVMKRVMARVRGAADGRLVQRLVRERLGG